MVVGLRLRTESALDAGSFPAEDREPWQVIDVLAAPLAVLAILGGVLLLLFSPSERTESALWLLAVVVAVPSGALLARLHGRALAGQSLAAWRLSATVQLWTLVLALAWQHHNPGEAAANAVIVLAGLYALAAPCAVARLHLSQGP